MTMKKGKCLCGYIVFEVQANPIYMVNCFCRDCQIVSGSQFYGAYGVPLNSGLKNLSNEPSSYKVISGSGREKLLENFAQSSSPELAVTTVVQEFGLKYLIFKLSKCKWFCFRR